MKACAKFLFRGRSGGNDSGNNGQSNDQNRKPAKPNEGDNGQKTVDKRSSNKLRKENAKQNALTADMVQSAHAMAGYTNPENKKNPHIKYNEDENNNNDDQNKMDVDQNKRCFNDIPNLKQLGKMKILKFEENSIDVYDGAGNLERSIDAPKNAGVSSKRKRSRSNSRARTPSRGRNAKRAKKSVARRPKFLTAKRRVAKKRTAFKAPRARNPRTRK